MPERFGLCFVRFPVSGIRNEPAQKEVGAQGHTQE